MKQLIFICLIQALILGYVSAQGFYDNAENLKLQVKKLSLPEVSKFDTFSNLFFHIKGKVIEKSIMYDNYYKPLGYFNYYADKIMQKKYIFPLHFNHSLYKVDKNIPLNKVNQTASLPITLNLHITPIMKIYETRIMKYEMPDFSELYRKGLLLSRPFTPENEFFIYREVMNEKLSNNYDKHGFPDGDRIKKYSSYKGKFTAKRK